ncbi:MAG: hypothetical protein AAFV29_05125 [Myxococcota bacterium]
MGSKKAEWTEFECPLCTAHNIWDDGFSDKDELFCSWCGAILRVRIIEDDVEPRFKLIVE